MKKIELRSIAAIASVALVATTVSASAALVVTGHSQGDNTPTSGASAAGYGAYLPAGATGWSANPTYTPPPGSVGGTTLSPFGNEVTPYFLVTTASTPVPPGQQSPVTLSFGSAQSSLSNFLWGSVDATNQILFKSGSTTVGTVTGTTLMNGGHVSGTGGNRFALVSFLFNNGETFDNIEFSTGSIAFEFATPIPLPAAAWLLIAGLGGLGLAARRRKTSDA